jgi:GNAT superfamily N-acetyltransferase
LSIYCAYVGGEPVGTGWTEFPPDSRFPELHGGAVLESRRGRGIYSDLFAVRVDEAKKRLYDFICVDAAPMSRPILQKIGFRGVCATVPMRKKVVAT